MNFKVESSHASFIIANTVCFENPKLILVTIITTVFITLLTTNSDYMYSDYLLCTVIASGYIMRWSVFVTLW